MLSHHMHKDCVIIWWLSNNFKSINYCLFLWSLKCGPRWKLPTVILSIWPFPYLNLCCIIFLLMDFFANGVLLSIHLHLWRCEIDISLEPLHAQTTCSRSLSGMSLERNKGKFYSLQTDGWMEMRLKHCKELVL
jgi:hypothetical protein